MKSNNEVSQESKPTQNNESLNNRSLKIRIARWIEEHLGEDWGGSPSAPGQGLVMYFGEPEDDGRPMYVARIDNDGSELWLGFTHDGWRAFYNLKMARQIAWFVLWDWWCKHLWFGLRKWIWFKALSVIVDSYQR